MLPDNLVTELQHDAHGPSGQEKTMERPSRLMNRNYVLQWQGQSVAFLGSQAFAIAMLFWIKHATGSATLMGLLEMLSNLPAVILGPIGGTLADRYSRRNIIILSDLGRGIAVLGLAGLMFIAPSATNLLLVVLFGVAIFNAVVITFFGPAISASIPDLVPEDRVTSANSLGQLSIQLSVFIGQGLGGVLFRLVGAPILFLINAISYLYAAASECFVAIPQTLPENKGNWREQFGVFKTDILEGLRYVWRRPGLRDVVFVSALLSFFTAPVFILLPFYVEDVLKVKVDWYGFLAVGSGVGTLLGYVLAATIKLSGKMRGRLMLIFIALHSMGYVILGLVRDPISALVLAVMGGVTGAFVTVNIMTVLQITTPSEIRGRIFGLLSAMSASLAPIAMGLAGVIADLVHQNIPLIYISCGAIMTILVILVSLNRDYRGFLAFEQAALTACKGQPEVNPAILKAG